jgi:PIN domain nuclease of toxin-antitoxin system
VILDTRVWVRYVFGLEMSKRATRRIVQASEAGSLRIAAVTLWEIALLAEARKLRLESRPRVWLTAAIARSGVFVEPLDPSIADVAVRLIGLLSDPADCQIAATALHHGLPLATRDARILEHAKTMGLEAIEA